VDYDYDLCPFNNKLHSMFYFFFDNNLLLVSCYCLRAQVNVTAVAKIQWLPLLL